MPEKSYMKQETGGEEGMRIGSRACDSDVNQRPHEEQGSGLTGARSAPPRCRDIRTCSCQSGATDALPQVRDEAAEVGSGSISPPGA